MISWLLISLGCRSSRIEAPPDAPNILLISLDTVRRDHLTPYGHRRDTSPHLNTIAQGGALFTNSYAQASSTIPTHASIFTGLHPFEHHTYGYDRALPGEHVTLAELLQGSGWRTVAATSSMKFDRGSGFKQGFDEYFIFGEGQKNQRSEKVNAEIKEFAAEESARPVFAFVHYFDAHAPYSAPESYQTLWHPGLDTPTPRETIDFIKDNRSTPVPAATLGYLASLYDGNIRFLDDNLRALLTDLSISNDRPTLLVITADHGEAFQEHGYLGHSTWVYEEIIQVPLVAHWPGRIPAGTRIDSVIQSIDLLPTIGELVGVTVPDGLPGRSFATTLLGGAEPGSRVVGAVQDPVAIFNRPRQWGISGSIAGVRYKLTRQGDDKHQLFRLDTDPEANHDIIVKHQSEAGFLLEAARQLGVPLSKKAARYTDNIRELSSEQIEQLEAMGYIDEVEQAR